MKRLFFAALIVAIMMSGCASLKLKDLNKVDAGMSKSKVVDLLGEPNSKSMECGKEIYRYEMKDEDGELRPRVVVFQDREVSFYGKPSELKNECSTNQNERPTNQNTNTNTVSPTITVSPSLNVVVNGAAAVPSPVRLPAGNGSYFHEIPTVNELNKANKGE